MSEKTVLCFPKLKLVLFKSVFFSLLNEMRTKLFLIGILCNAIFMTFLRSRWSRVKGGK